MRQRKEKNVLFARAWNFVTSERGRFLLIGAWNTLVGYLVFMTIHFAAGATLGSTWTLVLSYCIALPHSFVTQRLLVFRKAGAWREQFGRFSISNSVVFVSNLAFLPLAIAATGADPLVVQAVFVFTSTIASYLIHKHYSFAG